MKTINQWAQEVYDLAAQKGWHDNDGARDRGELIASYLMNLHSEVSEAWEAYRAGRFDKPCDKSDKMAAMGIKPLTCAEEELADVIIRAMDNAVALGIDIEAAIVAKHAYNATRGHRHGGKLA